MTTALALVSSLMWGGSDFIAGRLAGRLPVLSVVAGSQVFGLLLTLVLATATGSWGEPLSYLPWAALAAASGAAGLALFYSALAAGKMGVVAPIASAGVLVPFFVGVAVGQLPSVGQLVGVLAAFVGLIMATGPELSGFASRRTVIMAAIAAALFGTCLTAIAGGSQTSAVMTMTTMRIMIVATLLTVGVILRTRGGLTRQDVPLLVVIGTLDVGANLSYGIATTHGELAISAVLASLYPVVTMMLAWRILHERLRTVQYLGVAAVLAGVALIAVM